MAIETEILFMWIDSHTSCKPRIKEVRMEVINAEIEALRRACEPCWQQRRLHTHRSRNDLFRRVCGVAVARRLRGVSESAVPRRRRLTYDMDRDVNDDHY
ncbi:hypothetical protein EVAR_30687_1 [Eumeta japonica]|uniref:Uncharacterized protein n=1 Tax=Eumeta variegata TaxID=151549 RepID=A0A4C1VSS0_EUMVA|nr:hypothetical protein EVAR_30687_1 [Eumeta japonica]